MNGFLKTLSLLLLTYTLQSCGFGRMVSEEEKASVLRGTEWILDEKRNFEPILIFNKELTSISGDTGCNNYDADFLLKNFSFEIKAFISTEMFCEELQEDERDYFLRLSECSEFRIVKEDVLLLKNRADRVLLTFRKK